MRRRRSQAPVFPYTTLFRSAGGAGGAGGKGTNPGQSTPGGGAGGKGGGGGVGEGGGIYNNSDAGAVSFTLDRKSTSLNSSHLGTAYAVSCLKRRMQSRMTCT